MIQDDNGETLHNNADNAAFIVTACNVHDELVAALAAALPFIDGENIEPILAQARAALAKVQP